MVKRFTVFIIAALLLLQIAACGAPEATVSVSAVVSPTADSTPRPQISVGILADVSQTADDTGYYTCKYDGIDRKYILYIPEGAAENAPLVFMLHGYSASAKGFMDSTGMNAAADKYGYAVVYVQGLRAPGSSTGGACWNSGLTSTGNDDTGFLVALARYLQQTYGFSSSETFAAGFSNGAFMMYRLACEAPDTFRAVASVSGCMSGGAWAERQDSVSVGILQISGTADSVVPIDNSMSESGGYGGAPNILGVIEYWKTANGLTELEEAKISDKAAAYKYSSKENDNLVWYIEIKDGGHSWPETETAGFDANEVILEYFSNYVN